MYRVRVRKVFKGVVTKKKIVVISATDLKAGCGIRLTVGTVYVLMGGGEPLRVSQCLENKEWASVSAADRSFLASCAGANPDEECTMGPSPF